MEIGQITSAESGSLGNGNKLGNGLLTSAVIDCYKLLSLGMAIVLQGPRPLLFDYLKI